MIIIMIILIMDRKLYGPVKPGQEDKETRREEVTNNELELN